MTASASLSYEPQAVAIDARSGALWVLSYPELLKFDADGNRLFGIDLAARDVARDVNALHIDPYDGSLWVGSPHSLQHVTREGVVTGRWQSADPLRGISLDLDGTIRVLTEDALFHLSASAALLSRLDLKTSLSEPRYLAIDSLGNRIVIASNDLAVQLDLRNPSKPALPLGPLGQQSAKGSNGFQTNQIDAIAVHPVFGTLWVLRGNYLGLYDRSGKFLRNIDIAPFGLGSITKLVFDPVNLSLWAVGTRAIGQLRSTGELIDRTPVVREIKALATAPFKLAPGLSLVSPADGEVTNSALGPIIYRVTSECAGILCFLNDDAFGPTIDAQLNGDPIGSQFNVNSSTAVFVPVSPLPDGQSRLIAKVIDRFGHASRVVASEFIVDTVAPTFAVIAPRNGSSVNTAEVVIEGSTDDPQSTVVLEGSGLVQTGAKFRFTTKLRPGLNSLRLTATDRAGNTSTASFALHYNPPAAEDSAASNTSANSSSGSVVVPTTVGSVRGDSSNANSVDRPPTGMRLVRNDSTVGQQERANQQRRVAANSFGQIPLSFEPNRGQTHSSVKFLSRHAGRAVFLTSKETVVVWRSSADVSQRARFGPRGRSFPSSAHNKGAQVNDSSLPATVIRLQLVGAQESKNVEGIEPLATKSNYLRGNDPRKWIIDVPHYAKVRHRDVYPGIDQVFYGKDSSLEYDLVVNPGADPSQIKLRFAGAEPRLNDAGDIVLQTSLGAVTHRKPVVYQEIGGIRRPIIGRYALQGRDASIVIGAYDRSAPLTIDPVIVYSTYLGGSSDGQEGHGIAVDVDGSAYVTGTVWSPDFPTVNPLEGVGAGTGFVAKLAPDGRSLIYATYLGGSNWTNPTAISTDGDGNAYVAGYTSSTDFPTANALQSALKGATDGFVAKLNRNGNGFIYSTYLGGSGDSDYVLAIAADAQGNAYAGGLTNSADFPLRGALFQTASSSASGFVAKFDATGAIAYSTYFGAPDGFTNVAAIAVGRDGSAYVTGSTDSASFPTKNPIPAQSCPNMFVAKLSAAGDNLQYSTCIDTSQPGMSTPTGIAVDPQGNAFIAGGTTSSTFPTVNAYQSSLGSTSGSAFVAKIISTGDALSYSTYLGGADSSSANAIAIDATGAVYVTGVTWGSNFPRVNPLAGPIPTAHAYCFVTRFFPDGRNLDFSTLLGGNDGSRLQCVDNRCVEKPINVFQWCNGIATDVSGNAYVTGFTTAADFPVVDPLKGINTIGDSQAFITKISAVRRATTTTTLTASTTTITVGDAVTLTANVSGSAPTGAVDFMDGSLLLASVALSGSSATFSTTALNGGVHTITARYGGDGNNTSSISAAVVVTVNAYPTVNVISPVRKDDFIAPATINVIADAAVEGGTIEKVEFLNGTAVLATLKAPPYVFSWTNVPVGDYKLKVKVKSAGGLVTTSSPVAVTVLASPTITVNNVAEGAVISDDSITLKGTVQTPRNSSISVNGVLGVIDADGHFYVNNVPLTAGANTLTLTITTAEGQTTTQVLHVTSNAQTPFTFTATPTQGLAPLTANFTLTNRGRVTYARAELSCLGNDIVDRSVNAPTAALGSCLYSQTGTYTAKVKVYDNRNRVIYKSSQFISVGSAAAQDVMLRNVYFNMLARLRVGDVGGALNYVTATSYNKYNSVFTTLGPNLPSVSDQIKNLQAGSISDELADYVVVRNGQVFIVSLIQDDDRIWRLDGM